ncbi:MAG TPA: hypothetical protein PKZ75_10220 [Bacteroidia bacterium]|nr:hypothetical protein [Bacteroidia bacterium]
MNNPNKHKPLSSEELFQLLDKQSNNETDFDGMDDFEKDALEGFSAHSTPEKAKALTEELNMAISKKVSEEKGGQKNRIIWFSAAASIVLIIIVSVFFLKQTKDDSITNLALNETKESNTTPVLTEPLKPTEETTNSGVSSGETKPLTNNIKSEEVVTSKNTQAGPGFKQVTSESIVVSENQVAAGTTRLADVSKDILKNRNEGNMDELNSPSVAIDKKAEAKQKEKGNAGDSELDKTVTVESKSVTDANAVTQGTVAYKVDADYRVTKNEESKKLSKEKAAAEKSAVTTANKAAAVPAYSSTQEQSNQTAYYTGGETAIKEYIVNYLKEHSSSIILKGKYKVIGNVNNKGELKVTSITQITKEYCEGCSDKIKEALNTMKNWNSSSVVEFTLIF